MKLIMPPLLTSLFVSLLLATAASVTGALAAQSSLQLVINIDGNSERRITKYDCEGQDELFAVEYLNANPNYLAILTIEDKKIIFANVISGSGARYAAGQYVWSTKGAEAHLFDELRGTDPIFTCLEASETP